MATKMAKIQETQAEWHYQWSRFEGQPSFLFYDWIYPRSLEDFQDKRVFDAGCGTGHHMRLVAPVARHVTGMDLFTADIARENVADLANVRVLGEDISTHQPDTPYDVVYCIGVIHHTDDPDATFANLKSICREGGLVIVWCYSREGNEIVWRIVEPLRKQFLHNRSRRTIELLAHALTVLLYPFAYTVYRLPSTKLPFNEYLENFRRLSYGQNMLNVFDKLNAPQTAFISRQRIESWFNAEDFESVSISHYRGVSWHGSGIVRSG